VACGTGAGNLFLLYHVIITRCWVFCCIFIVDFFQTKGGLKFDLLTDFQLLNISSLSCECDNTMVLFFVSNLFLVANLNHVILPTVGFFAVPS